jgi:hypothetical protein
MSVTGSPIRDFDLNVETVLESWTAAHAVRELIANALDECVLSGTEPPTIAKLGVQRWEVRDTGRGLRYDHLTQNENPEKHDHADRVIGRFGVGLKDALAVLHRLGIEVEIASRHGVITLAQHAKAGFADVMTLHARVAPPHDPAMRGTAIRVHGIRDEDIDAAKDYFLAFSSAHLLEHTPYGDILERESGSAARIYVNGMVVAEEENFAFSYNITSMTEPMRRALNRERTHVGRGAYRERVKDMLLSAMSEPVAAVLVRELERVATGENRDEIKWADVQVHACRILNARRQVVFVTAAEHMEQRRFVDYATGEGRTVVTVPDAVGRQLGHTRDVNDAPVQSLARFAQESEQRFSYEFVQEHMLTAAERAVFQMRHRLFAAAGVPKGAVQAVRVSTTIQPSIEHGDGARGVWLGDSKTIIIRRDMLRSEEQFAGTLLHEVAHALSGATDVSLEFERALTDLLGSVSVFLMCSDAGSHRDRVEQTAASQGATQVQPGDEPSEGPPAGDEAHETAFRTTTIDPPPSDPLDGPRLARTLDEFRSLYPWSSFVEHAAGGIIPRRALRALGEHDAARHARAAWEWDAQLRAHGAEPGVESQRAMYVGERAVRLILGPPEPAQTRGTVRDPESTPCDNSDGSVAPPPCAGDAAAVRVRITRLDDRAQSGQSRYLCKLCADRLEQWGIERFLRVERGRVPSGGGGQRM